MVLIQPKLSIDLPQVHSCIGKRLDQCVAVTDAASSSSLTFYILDFEARVRNLVDTGAKLGVIPTRSG